MAKKEIASGKTLEKEYAKKKEEIQARLQEFKDIWKTGSNEEIFGELAFCICAFQNKAEMSDGAVRILRSNGILYKGTQKQIAKVLRSRVRFHNQKSRYIVETRKYFSENSHLEISDVLNRFMNGKKPKEKQNSHIRSKCATTNRSRSPDFGSAGARTTKRNLNLVRSSQLSPMSLSKNCTIECRSSYMKKITNDGSIQTFRTRTSYRP